MDPIAEVAAEQGWNVTSLWNMAREFIESRDLLPDFVQYLRTAQATENDYDPDAL